MRLLIEGIAIVFLLLNICTTGYANVKQLKTYRIVFPDYKPKCIYCHIDEKPKKEEGQHDLNAYGIKLQELMNGKELTAEMVETVGNHENFEDKNTDEPKKASAELSAIELKEDAVKAKNDEGVEIKNKLKGSSNNLSD